MATVLKTTRDVKGVGLSIPRPDGPEKVTGHVQYVADIAPRGLLHAKLLRSPHAHARIVRIDATKARALPGVRAVLTAATSRSSSTSHRRAPTPFWPSIASSSPASRSRPSPPTSPPSPRKRST